MATTTIDQDIDIYQNYINSYNAEDANKTKTKPVDFKTVNTNALEAFNQKENALKVFDEISRKKAAFDKPPRYFKPAFLLESLTPQVHAAVYLNKIGKNSQGGVEKYDLFSQTTAPTLLEPDPKPTHNYIRSFTYNVFGDSEGQKATLDIVDVDNSLVEALVMRFQTLSMAIGGTANPDSANVMIEITYGWSVPPQLQERYSRLGNGANVNFTNTILFILESQEVKFQNDGTINCIFHLQANANLVPPFTWWTPFKEFGTKFPLLPLATNNVLLNMHEKRQKNSDDVDFLFKFGVWFYLEMMAGAEDVTDLYAFIDSVRKIFNITSADSKPDKILPKDKLLAEAKRLFGGKDTKVQASNKKVEENSLGRSSISAAMLLKQSLGKINENNMVITGIDNKWIDNIQMSGTANPKVANDNQILNMLFPKDATLPATYEDILNFTERLKNDSKTNARSAKDFENWSNFLNKLTAFTLNWDIHPLLAEIYILEKFVKALDDYKAINPNEIEVVYISLIKQEDIQPRGYYDLLLDNKVKIFTRVEKEQWCKKIQTYSVTATTPWIDFLKDMMTAQKFNFQPTDKESAKLIGGADIEKNEDYKKTIGSDKSKGQAKDGSIPAQVQSNSFVTSPKGAKENLDIMIKLLKTNTANSVSKQVMTDKITKMRDLAANTIGQSMIRWIFLVKDQMPGGGIYDAQWGETQILQAYSFRGHNSIDAKNTQWNPGYPSCWDINFMDVLSFEPELNYTTALTAITTNLAPLKMSEGTVEYVDSDVKIQQKTKEKFESITKELESTKDETVRNQKLQEIQDLIGKLSRIKTDSVAKKRIGTYPVTFNMDLQRKTSNNGSVPEVLSGKKHIQQFRNRLMLEALGTNIKMTVIGDPSYQFNDAQKYIFNKIINNDGTLSIFTGLYNLKTCIQTISNGKFETQLEGMSVMSTDPSVAESMQEGIYNNDKMVDKNNVI